MKKVSAKRINNDLRPEYDLSRLTGGVRGKYYRQAMAGTNLMLIDPELYSQAAAGPARRRQGARHKRVQPTPHKPSGG
jgi:hypothetical protein